MSRQYTLEAAVERYLKERERDLADSTVYKYRSVLSQFTEWCDSQDHIKTVSDLEQMDIGDFRIYKRDQADMSDTALYNTMVAVRTFIRWCESRGLVNEVSADDVLLPDRGRVARTETIDPDRADDILDYLNKYEYATRRHALFTLLWDCGLRIGAVRSLDLDDFNSEDAYVELHHRPDEDTPLKNKQDSEREVNLHRWAADVIADYIKGHREGVADDYERNPLLTSKHGRPARTTLRRNIACITRPCYYSDECTVGREIKDCEATSWEEAAKCPESVKPHSIRRSSITNWLNEGHSKELISDRMDVSPDVLDEHYDARTEEEKRELRREVFEMGD